MNNYKHPSGSTAQMAEHHYMVTYNDNTKCYMDRCFIEDPRFGWEKVEEPFKENEWLFIDSGGGYETIFRFKSFNGSSYSTSESYQVYDNFFGKGVSINGDSGDHFAGTSEPTYRAAPEQVERILSIVARHKGFDPQKERIRVSRDWVDERDSEKTALKGLLGNGFHYNKANDWLTLHSIVIYEKGTWAKIVEEPKAAEPEVEAGYEYLCIKHVYSQGKIVFTKGKRYLFDRPTNGGMFTSTSDFGTSNQFSSGAMDIHFDMGTDWRTAKVFSYEDIEEDSKDLSKSITRSLKIAGEEFLLIPCKWLEEEAKKRTNA